jgi:hypothetical protein
LRDHAGDVRVGKVGQQNRIAANEVNSGSIELVSDVLLQDRVIRRE